MNEPPLRSRLPTKKNLENYASAYVGAYLNTVEKEKPDHAPAMARNHPHEVEVCLMPNQNFVMLFDRAEKQRIVVKEADWAFVESRIMSGVSHMVSVYVHEIPTIAEAISKGKRDAVRDIRTLEDSSISKAVTQLERILGELSGVEKGNKGLLKLAELEMSRLQPIKDAIMNAGPEADMLGMLDALKNYPTKPIEVNIDVKEKALLEKMCAELGDLSDIIRRVEAQDEVLEGLEKTMTKSLGEFSKTVDEKMNKGLAAVLSSSDRKIDKGLALMEGGGGGNGALEGRLKVMEELLLKMQETQPEGRHDVSKELVLAVADVRGNIDRLNARVERMEQYLVKISRARSGNKR
ncbi:MAG TPA: hypothetical protein VMW88_03230 [Thermoplasmata archaeon]|jgi:hypothetical protein|nr:hypothetical protein [Thermoplasmata archaeon]HUU07402.1 hypothetical protein [Thermoplasmata archaeon]